MPATTAAATLSQITWAMTKTIMAIDKMHSAEAARRIDACCPLGRSDPITLPAPSAVMKTPDQSADSPKEWASAGPRTRIGSAATVTAATMSSRTMILRSRHAMRMPFMTRERLAGAGGGQHEHTEHRGQGAAEIVGHRVHGQCLLGLARRDQGWDGHR